MDFIGDPTSVDHKWVDGSLLRFRYGTGSYSKRTVMSCSANCGFVAHSSTANLPCAISPCFLRAKCHGGRQMVSHLDHQDCGDTCILCVPGRDCSMIELPVDCPCRHREDRNMPRPIELCWSAAISKITSGDLAAEELEFCYDHIDLFADRYPKALQNSLGVEGYSSIKTVAGLINVLRTSDWYRLGAKKQRDMYVRIHKAKNEQGIEKVKTGLKNAILTATGAILKLRLIFPEVNMSRSKECAWTADIVGRLFDQYMGTCNGTYEALKDLGKGMWKAIHTREFEFYELEDSPLFGFLMPYKEELIGLSYEVENVTVLIRKALLLQNRFLAQPPINVVDAAREEWLTAAKREPEVDTVQVGALYKAACEYASFYPIDGSTINMDALLEHSVKPRGCTESSTESGGKFEATRNYLNNMKEAGNSIRKIDLNTGELIMEINPSEFKLFDPFILLFYYSIMVAENLVMGTRHAVIIDPLSMMKMVLMFIMEPGKARPLTKSSTLLFALTAPLGALTRAILSQDPDHAAGIGASEHAFYHDQRLLPDLGSGFYNSSTELREEGFIHGFSDWKSATDWVRRSHGLSLLQGFCKRNFIYPYYTEVVLKVSSLPFQVEVNHTLVEMHEMWPMGLPLSKTVLHLMHSVTGLLARYKLLGDVKQRFCLKARPKGYCFNRHEVEEVMADCLNEAVNFFNSFSSL